MADDQQKSSWINLVNFWGKQAKNKGSKNNNGIGLVVTPEAIKYWIITFKVLKENEF